MKNHSINNEQHQEFVYHLITQQKKSKEEVITELTNFGVIGKYT